MIKENELKSFKEVYTQRRTRFILVPDDNGIYWVDNGEWQNDHQSLSKGQHYSKTLVVEHEIAGTALAVVATLWELLFTSPKLWTWFRGLITDGYWMVFSSPFILVYWIIVTLLYLPFVIILAIISIIAIPYTELIEVPASWMNKESLYFLPDDILSESSHPFILGGKVTPIPNEES
jgi:hypothetical protein